MDTSTLYHEILHYLSKTRLYCPLLPFYVRYIRLAKASLTYAVQLVPWSHYSSITIRTAALPSHLLQLSLKSPLIKIFSHLLFSVHNVLMFLSFMFNTSNQLKCVSDKANKRRENNFKHKTRHQCVERSPLKIRHCPFIRW